MKKRGKTYPIDQCRLYKITSPEDLATRLSTSMEELEALAQNDGNYRVFPTGPKEKPRTVEEPKAKLQRFHARIHVLLSRIEAPDYLHSAIKGRSYISNAQAHINDGNVIKVDVRKFFRSAPKAAVFRFFRDHLKCADHAAGLLANLLTYNGHLPTGSSSSPIISYYSFKDMFDEIEALALERSLTMTCYVDDIAISGKQATPKLLYKIRQIIARAGLQSHKAKFFNARRPKIITGVVIAQGAMKLPNKRHLRIKQGYEDLLSAVSPEEKIEILKSLTSRVHEAALIDSAAWLPKAKELQRLHSDLRKAVNVSE